MLAMHGVWRVFVLDGGRRPRVLMLHLLFVLHVVRLDVLQVRRVLARVRHVAGVAPYGTGGGGVLMPVHPGGHLGRQATHPGPTGRDVSRVRRDGWCETLLNVVTSPVLSRCAMCDCSDVKYASLIVKLSKVVLTVRSVRVQTMVVGGGESNCPRNCVLSEIKNKVKLKICNEYSIKPPKRTFS